MAKADVHLEEVGDRPAIQRLYLGLVQALADGVLALRLEGQAVVVVADPGIGLPGHGVRAFARAHFDLFRLDVPVDGVVHRVGSGRGAGLQDGPGGQDGGQGAGFDGRFHRLTSAVSRSTTTLRNMPVAMWYIRWQ